MANDVRFIRVNGRVVPVKGKGSAPKGVSKRYGAKREKPKVKSIGVAKGAAVGTLASSIFARPKHIKSYIAAVAAGGIAGAAIGSLKFTKRGKGESKTQLAKRVAKKSGV